MSNSVLLIRAENNEVDARALAKLGIESLIDPYLVITAAPDSEDAERLLTEIGSADWLVLTSASSMKFWSVLVGEARLAGAISSAVEKGLKLAALGESSAESVRKLFELADVPEIFLPEVAYSENLAEALIALANGVPKTAVLPQGNIALVTLPSELAKAGWSVTTGVLYQTGTPEETPFSTFAVKQGQVGSVLLRSPSAAKAFAKFNSGSELAVICAGKTTAEAARTLGLNVKAIADAPDPESVAHATQAFINQTTKQG